MSQNGFDFDARHDDRSLMEMAISENAIDVVKKLVELKPALLGHFSASTCIHCFDALISAEKPPLFLAAEQGGHKIVRTLMDLGACPHFYS